MCVCTHQGNQSPAPRFLRIRSGKTQDQKEDLQRCFLIAWLWQRLSLVTRDSINVSPSLDPFADWLRLDTLFAHDNGCFCRFRPRGVPSSGRSLRAFLAFILSFLPFFLAGLLDLTALISEVVWLLFFFC